jgi:Sec-independent protein translocase protein TatA
MGSFGIFHWLILIGVVGVIWYVVKGKRKNNSIYDNMKK